MIDDRIRVVIADDHAVVRAGMRAVLAASKDIEVIGEARNGVEAVTMAERYHPDIVIMDLGMPELDGASATKQIVAKGLSARVIVLTMQEEADYLVPLMEAGAAGYLVKTAADRELVDAIRVVAHGDVYVRPAAARVLARQLSAREAATSDRAGFDRLTQREQEVLRLVARGYSAPEVGERLLISPKTVDTYKQRIQEKLGLAHRSDYVQLALKLGILAES